MKLPIPHPTTPLSGCVCIVKVELFVVHVTRSITSTPGRENIGEKYVVEHIVGERTNRQTGLQEFYTKWRDYPASDNTWEEEHNFYPELISDFRIRKRQQREQEMMQAEATAVESAEEERRTAVEARQKEIDTLVVKYVNEGVSYHAAYERARNEVEAEEVRASKRQRISSS